ncbi:MAG: hypothetical protein LUI85_00620 [Bacteroides sp.]|nr:hypothetical protein [Bacteroides sp.]
MSVCIGFLLFSCSQEEVSDIDVKSLHDQNLPDVQVYITKASITIDAVSSRNCGLKNEHICFHDSISGKTYDYNLITYSNNEYAADFNKDGIPDLKMTVDGDTIVGKIGEYTDVLNIQKEVKDNCIFYDFDTVESARSVSYVHISWWGCVSRLASTPEVGILSMFTGASMAGALAIICLDDNNRWEVN